MSNRWIKVVPVAPAVPLIVAGCSSSGSQVDQRSYDAGYRAAGPLLASVRQGLSATSACQEAVEDSYLFVPIEFQNYDTMSFNGGCYSAIRDNGLPVRADTGGLVHGFN
jgi:hypothetical protein